MACKLYSECCKVSKSKFIQTWNCKPFNSYTTVNFCILSLSTKFNSKILQYSEMLLTNFFEVMKDI